MSLDGRGGQGTNLSFSAVVLSAVGLPDDSTGDLPVNGLQDCAVLQRRHADSCERRAYCGKINPYWEQD